MMPVNMINFQCTACKIECANQYRQIEGFKIHGFDSCLTWSEAVDDIPLLNENNGWMRLNEAPVKSEERVVSVCAPFSVELEKEFWTFFVPGLSSVNGLMEHMDEIEKCAFIKCKVEKVLELDNHSAWLKVLVTDSIPVPCVTKTLKSSKQAMPPQIDYFEWDHMVRYKDWIYYSGDAQGNLGNWMIIKMEKEVPHLLVLGEWNFHEDTAYLGNLILQEEVLDRVLMAKHKYPGPVK